MGKSKVVLAIIALFLGIAVLSACESRNENVTDAPGKKATSSPAKDTPAPTDPADDHNRKDPADDPTGDDPTGNPLDPFNPSEQKDSGNTSKYVKTDPFGVDIPSNGGVNYEFTIYKGVTEGGDEIDERYLPKKSWFISYHRSDCEISIPLSNEAIGTELYSIEPNFTSGTKEFTEYGQEGMLLETRLLRLNISSSSATIYDEVEHVTYYCTLYRTFTYTN